MGEMGIGQAFEEFKTIYLPARNYAMRTRKEYSNDLRELVKLLESLSIRRIRDVSLFHLERYLASLDEKGFAGATRKRKVVAIHTFFYFLAREGYLVNDISKRLITPFAEQKMPRVLTQSEYQKLLDACKSHPRDNAIVTILLQTGIRLSELAHLKLSDIDLPESEEPKDTVSGTISIIRGGGRKDRRIPINMNVCQIIRDYLADRADTAGELLFINHSEKPLGIRGIQKILYKYFATAGIKGASVHSLRHTFAVHHVAKGTSLKTIQEVLGHAEIRTTQTYVSLAQELKTRELITNAL